MTVAEHFNKPMLRFRSANREAVLVVQMNAVFFFNYGWHRFSYVGYPTLKFFPPRVKMKVKYLI